MSVQFQEDLSAHVWIILTILNKGNSYEYKYQVTEVENLHELKQIYSFWCTRSLHLSTLF